MTLDSLEFNWRDKTVHVGIDCRGQGPTILMLPALSSISTRSEVRPLGEKLASIHLDAYRAFLAQILRELPRPAATWQRVHAAGYLLCHAAEHPGTAGRLCLVEPILFAEGGSCERLRICSFG